jgi:hypothetical protein
MRGRLANVTNENYEPHFDIDFTRGRVGESLVETFLADLQGKKIEVKTDYRVSETGNVYVETWQYHLPDASDKKQSGINITKSDYYCFASPDATGFIMIKTDALKDVIRQTDAKETRQPKINSNTNASFGRLVKITDIMEKLKLWQSQK